MHRGNKEWREKELGKKDKGGKGGKVKATPFDSLRMMHWLRAFSMSNLPESLVEGNWDKAAVEEITGMALSIGLFWCAPWLPSLIAATLDCRLD